MYWIEVCDFNQRVDVVNFLTYSLKRKNGTSYFANFAFKYITLATFIENKEISLH